MGTDPSPSERLEHTRRERLEGELMLGGRWLPRVRSSDSHAEPVSGQTDPSVSPNAQHQEANMPTHSEGSEFTDKQARLGAVAQRVAACTKCPLHQSRLNPVPGEGNPDARIVFVGEAPGQNEDEQGRPFVGRAGQLLTKIIEAMGLKREDVFICNILKSRPPGNRDPQADEVFACSEYLQEQLEIIQPEVIVALGAHAARKLLDTDQAIGKLRGRLHPYYPSPLSPPINLVATYHPAYLLRNYTRETRLRVWEDMQMVLQELNLPIPNYSAG